MADKEDLERRKGRNVEERKEENGRKERKKWKRGDEDMVGNTRLQE